MKQVKSLLFMFLTVANVEVEDVAVSLGNITGCGEDVTAATSWVRMGALGA